MSAPSPWAGRRRHASGHAHRTLLPPAPQHQGRGRNRRWRVLASYRGRRGLISARAFGLLGLRVCSRSVSSASELTGHPPIGRSRSCARARCRDLGAAGDRRMRALRRRRPLRRRDRRGHHPGLAVLRPGQRCRRRRDLHSWSGRTGSPGAVAGSAAEGGVPYTYVDVGRLGPLPGMYEPHERCPASARPPRPRQWRSHGPPVGYWSRFAPEEQSTERQGLRYIWSRTHPRSRRDVDSSAMVGSKSSAADRPNRLMIPGIAGAGQRAFSGDSARRATTLNTSRRIVPLLPRMTNQ